MNKYCDKHGQLQPCVECLAGYAAKGGLFVAKQATPPAELIEQLMDSRIPKTEREHAAAAEIEALRQRLSETNAENHRLKLRLEAVEVGLKWKQESIDELLKARQGE